MANDQNIVRGRHLDSLAADAKRFTLEQNLALNQAIQAELAELDTGGEVFTGATSSTPGVIGYVPAPAAGKQTSFLRGDGTWVIPTDTNTTYSAATTTSSGLMSYSDKRKLNNLASITTAGANVTITNGTIKAADTTYSVATTSTNGLMSSTDKAKLNNLASITSAGTNVTISSGVISAGTTFVTDSAFTSMLNSVFS